MYDNYDLYGKKIKKDGDLYSNTGELWEGRNNRNKEDNFVKIGEWEKEL
jgi:hypothetical protein